MNRFILNIFKFFSTRRISLFILLLLSFIAFAFFSTRIGLEEDIAAFMPKTPETERATFVMRNIKVNDKIIIKLSLNDSTNENPQDELTRWADFLADTLQKNPGEKYITSIFYKVDDAQIFETSSFILRNTPLFLKKSDYAHIDSLLSKERIAAILEQNKKDLISPLGMVYKRFTLADPLHISSPVFSKLRLSSTDTSYYLYNGYLFSKDQKSLLLFINSAHTVSETSGNEVLAKALDAAINEIKKQSNNKVEVTSFGAAIVGVDNANQIKKDTWLSVSISLILIIFLLVVFFRNIRSLLLLLVPVLFGVCFSLSILYFVKGSISAIAIGAGSAIIGIAINYTLHFLIHLKHTEDIQKNIKDLVSPLLVGSITTIGAFLSLLFVSSDSLHDFGLFAALSLTGTIFFVLVFLPHLVKKENTSSSSYPEFFDSISDLHLDKSPWAILCVFLLTIIFTFSARNMTFESDMNKISYMTAEQKKAYAELSGLTNIAQKSIFHVAEGRNLDEALQNYEKIKPTIDSLVHAGKIKSVSGIGEMLMSSSSQSEKIRQWGNFWSNKKDIVQKNILTEGKKIGFKENSFDTFFVSLNKKYNAISLDKWALRSNMLNEFIIEKDGRAMIISILYVNPENEKIVYAALNHIKNSYVFDRASTTKAMINSLSNDFNYVLFICGFIVFVFLTISFGRLELSLITFIPMAFSWLWILGLMSIFDVKFNIVNIILATFIFGLGDDYSIFIMEGSMHEYTYKRKILSSYKLAVFLSALTMFIGIGSLIFAKHPAMKSLAQVTIIGMVSVVLISYTLLPFLFRWLTTKKGHKRLIPITAANLAKTIYSFTAFLIGSLYLSISGFILLHVFKSTPKRKLRYHKILRWVTGFVVKHLPGVKKHYINFNKEDFSKPAVIIVNHQSHLDLVLMMMLSPRIVILTNDWVWNSPFYGKIVKYADFYPVANGIENSIDILSTLVEQGYSILVFPEGTRSEDCSINRFHKGAFFLAEKLNLDIIPIIIHGVGHCLPKSELLLRKGEITVKILDRIRPDDNRFGENYSQRAKQVRKWFSNEFEIVRKEVEVPAYFADKIKHNYLYKGSGISTSVNINLKKYNNYSDIIAQLPDVGAVLVMGSNLGEFPLMLSMVKRNLTIDVVEANEEKIAVAENCNSKSEQITFIEAEPLNYGIIKPYDYIALVDCLQKFTSNEAEQLIRKCLNTSAKLIISDLKQTTWDKIRLKISGCEVQKRNSNSLSILKEFEIEPGCELKKINHSLSILQKK